MNDKRAAARQSKWLLLSCAVLLSATAHAQKPNDSNKSNIEILRLHWEKQVRLPRNFDPAVIPTGGTFNDPASRTSSATPTSPLDAVRAASRAQNTLAAGSTAFPETPARLPVVYVYSMKVRNRNTKAIEAIAWDYVFIEPTTKTEVGRHQFLSYQKVAADKTVTLQSQLRSPPTRVVQASDSRAKHAHMTERGIVQCVLYADDSTWRNPGGPIDICSLLRKNRNVLKQNRRETRSQ